MDFAYVLSSTITLLGIPGSGIAQEQPFDLDATIARLVCKARLPLRREAVLILGRFRCEPANDSLRALASDREEQKGLRRVAMQALNTSRDPGAVSVFQSILDTETDLDVRCDAAGYLASFGKRGDCAALREGIQQREETRFRLMCAATLAAIGVEDMSAGFHAMCEQLLKDEPQTAGALAGCLGLLTEKRHRRCVKAMLDSDSLRVRARAERAWARLGGDVDKLRDGNRYSQLLAKEELFRRQVDEDRVAIERAGWRRASLDDLLEAVRTARVVVCGEAHMPEGHFVRKLQRKLVDAMRQGRKGPVRVGYEPSVFHVQKGVTEYASTKGIDSIPMEVNWKQHMQLGASGARDSEASRIANAWLQKDPENRLLVLRGQQHVYPTGPLARQLVEKPVLVFTIPEPLGIPLKLVAQHLADSGLVLRSKELDNVWFVWCDAQGLGSGGGPARKELYRTLSGH